MAKKQLFKCVDKVGYSILGGKNFEDTLDWIEYKSKIELDKMCGENVPDGFHYIYVIDETDWGEEKKSSFVRWNIGMTDGNVYNRYQGRKSENRHRVIRVFLSRLTDHEIHNKILETDDLSCVKHSIDNDSDTSREFFDVYSCEDCQKLMSYLEQWTNDAPVIREKMEIYYDTNDEAKKVAEFIQSENMKGKSPHLGGNICCRGGKTNENIVTWLYTPARHMILTTYVGTVTKGYIDLVEGVHGYENIKIVDATNAHVMSKSQKDKILADVESHMNSGLDTRVLWIIPLTGTSPDENEIDEHIDEKEFNNTFDNRSNWIISFLNNRIASEGYAVSNDEVDFGSACEKQVAKISNLCNIGGYAPLYKMSLSGTNAHKAEKIWGMVDYSIDKDYIDLRKVVEEK